jgi:hypothetical protein
MLARRVSLLAAFFVVSVGLSAIVHRVLYPERVATILPIFGVQILVSLAAVAMTRSTAVAAAARASLGTGRVDARRRFVAGSE